MAVLLAAAVLLAGCDDSDDGELPTPSVELPTPEELTAPGPYAVGVTTYELVDTSRPTAASGDVPASDERLLTTEVWYPAVADASIPDGRDLAADASGGPYPLIVFAHGLSASRLFYPEYTRHLASHGYVVAAPDFPLTRIGTPGGTRFLDTINQAGDVSFVIDRMLEFNATSGHLLNGVIDGETIGLTGHSGGGFTTLLTVYGVYGAERDERIDAGVSISGSGCFYQADDVDDVGVPMMFLTGSEDLIIPRRGNRVAYENAQPPRYWVEVRGANHVRFSFADIDDALVTDGLPALIGDDDASADEDLAEQSDDCFGGADAAGETPITLAEQQRALRLYATPFFDAYLRRDAAALRFLQETLPALDVAAYEFEAE
jgi:predicted dienelactone hydrolase